MVDDITHTSEDTLEIDEEEFKELGKFIELKTLAGPLRSIKYINEFRVALTNPLKIQTKILKEILKKNKNTNYGRLYNFSGIKTIEDYQNQVPVITYEDIIPFIQKIKDGEQNILTKDKILFLATTSGTTSSVKLIPVTKDRMKNFKRELYLWSVYVLKDHTNVLKGKTLYFAGPYIEGKTSAGIICGSISGYLIAKAPWYIKSKVVVPPETYNIFDFDKKIKVIAINALKSNITQFAFASPIEAILFLDYIAEHKDELINELERTGLEKRAKELKELSSFKPTNIWPNLCLIGCIKSKFNLHYLETLKEKIGKDIEIRDPGIYASEGRLSLGLEKEGISGIIPAHVTFFEFIEKKEDGKDGEPITIDKLELEKNYEVIITTTEGLYRYRMGDIVKVTGYKQKLPLIEFVDRNNYLNIAGELAHENILISIMYKVIEEVGIKIKSFTFMPYSKDPSKKPRYEILIELLPENTLDDKLAIKLKELLDKTLKEYISDYRQMREEFGRLDSPVLSILKQGSYDEFDKRRTCTGGQPKPIHLSKTEKFRENFEIIKTYE